MDKFLEQLNHEFHRPFENSVLIFCIILLIILLAPILLRKIRIPGIIGLIVSGIIIGPHGLNMIEQNAAVDLFSTIGLLYIMFIAGLELDLKEFSKNKHKSVIFGFLTFIFPLAIGLPVCMYLLGYGFMTSLLTASMFATHTLVTYPIVSRLGVSKNEAVAITVGGTILTDTAVLIILAVVTGAVEGGLTSELWIRLGISFFAFVAFVVLVIPAVSGWFFRHWEDEKHAHYIYVLTIVFFCAFIAEIAGLEPILGAFAAGLVLNKFIPHTSPLMNRIEFVGNSLFIPFFLISVGMLVNIDVLMQGPSALIVAAALTIVSLFGKWIASYLIALFMKYSKAQRNVIFGLSSAHAAATLAVILVGYRIGIIDENILNGTVILILITCLVASFVTESAGKSMALVEDRKDPTTSQNHEEKILVPISNPDTMERLVDFALTIKNPVYDTPIYGLAVVQDDEKAQVKLSESRKILEKAIAHASSSDQQIEVITTIDQNVCDGIRRVSKEVAATDIILGSSSKVAFSDRFFGGFIHTLLNSTHQEVLVYNPSMALNLHQNVRLICPPHSEKEFGFHSWLEKIMRLAGALTVDIYIYSSKTSYDNINNFIRENKLSNEVKHKDFNEIEDFLVLAKDFKKQDIIVVVSPRKGSLSYNSVLDMVPIKLNKHLAAYSYIVVYPKVEESKHLSEISQYV
ncbi:cation:proton antiporter [Nafulsella turpanensis]|uniref:cation:proton antiporter n=1 Tax=Nafulsella turpanensis TaxID=1265690 RepID=UPI00037FCC78|nr:cation:proton antiporter [Nafulsella turpanensis]